MLLWVGLFVGFHAGLTFTANFGNVLRYNLPALPGIAWLSSLPLVLLADWLLQRDSVRRRAGVLVTLGLIAPVLLLSGRPDYHFTAYGFLDGDGRQQYALLAEHLPANAVILTDDQHAGALAMYTDFAVARPQYWNQADFEVFLSAMRHAGRPVVTLGTPTYPLDFVWAYAPEPTGARLVPPPDGGDGLVHHIP